MDTKAPVTIEYPGMVGLLAAAYEAGEGSELVALAKRAIDHLQLSDAHRASAAELSCHLDCGVTSMRHVDNALLAWSALGMPEGGILCAAHLWAAIRIEEG